MMKLLVQPQAKVLAVCLILSVCCLQLTYSSAIPIWEFLTRTEKLSHLYSTFAQLVSVHCKASNSITSSTTTISNQPAIPVNQCKRNLLTYGNEKLQTFTDAQLDRLEPYQRNANELIWSAIMDDKPSFVSRRKPTLPQSSSTSFIILAPNKDFKNNPMFERDNQHKYAMDMDGEYGGYRYDKTDDITTYLTGPLVFRVRPDGTPVDDDRQQPLPRDDDLDQFYVQQSTTTTVTPPVKRAKEGRINKHRKIATISSLKQQRFANLHSPFLSPRLSRRIQDGGDQNNNLASMFADYYYNRKYY